MADNDELDLYGDLNEETVPEPTDPPAAEDGTEEPAKEGSQDDDQGSFRDTPPPNEVMDSPVPSPPPDSFIQEIPREKVETAKRGKHNWDSTRSVYVGAMNWWTTDLDIIDACHSVGAKDVEQLSIYENKETGRSKGYGVVTCASSEGSWLIAHHLVDVPVDKNDPHGRKYLVQHATHESFSIFGKESLKLTGDQDSSHGQKRGKQEVKPSRMLPAHVPQYARQPYGAAYMMPQNMMAPLPPLPPGALPSGALPPPPLVPKQPSQDRADESRHDNGYDRRSRPRDDAKDRSSYSRPGARDRPRDRSRDRSRDRGRDRDRDYSRDRDRRDRGGREPRRYEDRTGRSDRRR